MSQDAVDITAMYNRVHLKVLKGGYTQEELKTLHTALVGIVDYFAAILADVDSKMQGHGE